MRHNYFFRWLAVVFIITIFVSFALMSPSASAQEGNPPVPTDTPTEISTEEPGFYPTIVPTPTVPLEITPDDAQPFSMQGFEESVPQSATGWSLPENISLSVSASINPDISIAPNGSVHIVWVEVEGGHSDVVYKYRDELGVWSPVINASDSGSFNAGTPQIITDSNNTAHIVWSEDDFNNSEIMYTRCSDGSCLPAVNLSGPANWDCGKYPPNLWDWKSEFPTIGIDQSNQIMVLWRAYEPNEITMPYSTWEMTGSPPATPSGCIPYHPDIPKHVIGAAQVAGRGERDFRLVYEELPDGGLPGIYYGIYSDNSFTKWTTSLLGNGDWPDIYLKDINPVHATWCGSDGLAKYWNSDASVESISDALCGARVSVGVDSVELPHIFSNHNSQIYENIRYPEGWSSGVSVSRTPNGAAQQDVAVDAIGNLHLVWLDGRDGNYEIYYSSTATYDCSGVSLSPIAQAVFDVIKESEPTQEFCGNKFDDLIILPPGEPAFQRFHDLAVEAKYEVNFTTMFWDKQSGQEDGVGYIFLRGIKELYQKVQQNPENFPVDGVHVRILVGVKRYISNNPDQRIYILRDMENLDIPVEDNKWRVEVAVYREGDSDPTGTGLFGTHSHVKLMIVDGKTVIASGYNMQDDYLEDSRQDMGVEVNGPIAIRSLMVFDELWKGASRCDEYIPNQCGQETTVENITHNPEILYPIVIGGDTVFSLFRDKTNKLADDAIASAINEASSNVNIIQNRFMNDFWNPPQYAESILNVLNKGEGQVIVNLLVSGSDGVRPLDDLELSTAGICQLWDQLYYETPIGTYNFTARYSSQEKPIHTKALSLDGYFTIVGSQNFDPSAWGENTTGSYEELGDLAEYSLGIDSVQVAQEFNSEFNEEFSLENGTQNITCPYNTFSPTSLQSVIDQTASGSVVFIPAGVYTESVTINKPLTLIGANPSQTIIQPVGNEPTFRITSSDVTIANMKIKGGDGYGIELIDSSPSSLKNILIYRIVFEENEQGGVLVQGLIPGSPMNYTIENSTFIGGGSGITINMLEVQAEKSLIRNNIFYSQLRFPIEILSETDSHVEYSFNLFDNCDLGSCITYWRDTEGGVLSPLSSQNDNLFDLGPRFISAGDGAYQLSTTSPAIDAGDPSMFHELYFDGNGDEEIRIDIGAFEYAPFTNLPPVVTANADQSIELGSPVTINTTYTDEDNIEDHTSQISWGDGVVENIAVNSTAPKQGEVIGTHTYTDIGSYTVEICVVDLHGGVGCDTMQINVNLSSVPVNFYLHGSGANANPATLYLNTTAPTGTTAKYKDSTSINFNNGNPWKDVGAWILEPEQISGELTDINNLQVWLGLKNSDDQGTNFDLRVELYRNDILIGSNEELCITGITRNANLAKLVTLSVEDLMPADFDGVTDILSLKIKTRIGTNDLGGMCGGHSNAVGLRLYFDASNRPSSFESMIAP